MRIGLGSLKKSPNFEGSCCWATSCLKSMTSLNWLLVLERRWSTGSQFLGVFFMRLLSSLFWKWWKRSCCWAASRLKNMTSLNRLQAKLSARKQLVGKYNASSWKLLSTNSSHFSQYIRTHLGNVVDRPGPRIESTVEGVLCPASPLPGGGGTLCTM